MSRIFLCGKYSASLEAMTQPDHVSFYVLSDFEHRTSCATTDDDIVIIAAIRFRQLCRGACGSHLGQNSVYRFQMLLAT